MGSEAARCPRGSGEGRTSSATREANIGLWLEPQDVLDAVLQEPEHGFRTEPLFEAERNGVDVPVDVDAWSVAREGR